MGSASTPMVRVWCSDVGPNEGGVCLRVREGGEVLDRIELDRPCYACMLGGEDGRTLFMLCADWRMSEGFEDNIARLTQRAAHRQGPDRPGARAGRRVAVGQSSSAIRAAARAAPSVSTGR